MKSIQRFLFIMLALLTGGRQVAAQTSQFFRISGPNVTIITALNPDGTLVWSNALAGSDYTFQTATTLANGGNWVDYVHYYPGPAPTPLYTNQLVDFNPPAGMALIPAGTFTMGDSLDGENDAIPTNVYVSAFYMDVNLVTYGQWQSVYNWATNAGYIFDNAGAGKAVNHPVQTVNWYDCVKWCNARSQQAGLTPVYYTDTNLTQVYTTGDIDAVYPNWAVNGYRLPTEAEWEKAARGGLGGQRFPWGNTISEGQANYFGSVGNFGFDLGPSGYNSIGSIGGISPATSPVGSFAANDYGLNDMAGNVFEWCWDWYGSYGQPTTTDPTGSGTGSFRVVRGGDWDSFAIYARCAYRDDVNPYTYIYDNVGFRCVSVRGH